MVTISSLKLSSPPTTTLSSPESCPCTALQPALQRAGLEGKEGLPRGQFIELAGPWGGGKTRFLLSFLNENPRFRVAWVQGDPQRLLEPGAFFSRESGISDPQKFLDRLWVIEPPTNQLWSCLHPLLRSQALDVIIFQADASGAAYAQETELRRLQILARQSRCLLFWLKEQPTRAGAWPIGIQLWVQDGEASILKWGSQRNENILEVAK